MEFSNVEIMVILTRAWFQWSDGGKGSREKRREESETVNIGNSFKKFCPKRTPRAG